MSLSPVHPEFHVFAERGLLYPPLSVVLVETTPSSYPEALFLYMIHKRLELNEEDLFVASLLEDFETTLQASVIPSPLVLKFRDLLRNPRVHYRFFETVEDLMKAVELHYKNIYFMYIYTSSLTGSKDLVEMLTNFVRKVKSTLSRTFNLTVFIDSENLANAAGRRLEYLADIIFEVKEATEMGNVSIIYVKRTKLYPKPDIVVEYSLSREEVVLQVIRSI